MLHAAGLVDPCEKSVLSHWKMEEFRMVRGKRFAGLDWSLWKEAED